MKKTAETQKHRLRRPRMHPGSRAWSSRAPAGTGGVDGRPRALSSHLRPVPCGPASSVGAKPWKRIRSSWSGRLASSFLGDPQPWALESKQGFELLAGEAVGTRGPRAPFMFDPERKKKWGDEI